MRSAITSMVAILSGLSYSPLAFAEEATTVPGTVAIAGTSWKFSPYIETEGGYDTNPDGLVARVGSSFAKIETGGDVKAKSATETYIASVRARNFEYEGLERPHRWDFRAALEGQFDLPDQQTLKLGSSFLRDRYSLNQGDLYRGFVDYSRKGENYRLRLQGKSELLSNEDHENPGDIDVDLFNAARGRAFDYLRSEGQVALLTFTQLMVQPFAIYNWADANYYNQVEDRSIDRNAREQFAIAGVRLQLDPSFRVDVGQRINERHFDDSEVHSFHSSFYDINVYWSPAEWLTITGVVERTIKEPSTALGLADDVRTYGATISWRLSPQFRINGDGFYDHIAAIGDTLVFDKYTARLSGTYEVTKNLELFVSMLGRWNKEETTGESYQRYRIGSGVRINF